MKPIETIHEILYDKIYFNILDERVVVWAIDMLEAGFDSEHLRMLAGAEKPYSYFALNPLYEKVINELGIKVPDSTKITENYINYMVDKVIVGNENPIKAVTILKDLCVSNNYQKELMDFYLLYFAKIDLQNDTVQWYWPDADRSNIDTIILDYFKKWKHDHENDK